MWKCQLRDTKHSFGCKQFIGVEWMYCAGLVPSVSRQRQQQNHQWAARPSVWQLLGRSSRSDWCLYTIGSTGINVCQTVLWRSLCLCVFLHIPTFYVLVIPPHYATFHHNWIGEMWPLNSDRGTFPAVLLEDSSTSRHLPILKKTEKKHRDREDLARCLKGAGRILGSAAHPMNVFLKHCIV